MIQFPINSSSSSNRKGNILKRKERKRKGRQDDSISGTNETASVAVSSDVCDVCELKYAVGICDRGGDYAVVTPSETL